MSLIHNERTKLTATWLNTLGAGSIVTGAVAPSVAYLFGVQGTGDLPGWFLLLSAAVWILAGTGLHLLARLTLRRLRP